MKKHEKNTIYLGALLLFAIFAFGCGKKGSETIVVSELAPCTISQLGTDAVISCPDGSEITLPAQVITETITQIETVIIRVPTKKCKKD